MFACSALSTALWRRSATRTTTVPPTGRTGGSNTATGSRDVMMENTLNDVGNPTSDQDVATKA